MGTGVNGENLGIAYSSSGDTTTAHVGSYAITCSGADAGPNYTVRYETGTLQVTRATATVIADNQSKVYGTADPSYTFAVQGLVGGDTLTTPATCSVAGAHHDVGTYPITCSGASAGGNYDIAYLGGTLTEIGRAHV